MTDLSLARLCAFTYLHMPPSVERRLPATVASIARTLLAAGRTDCETLTETQKRVLRALGSHIETAEMKLQEYINWNNGNGFAACVFTGRHGAVIAMRGSERRGLCASGNEDWHDNFLAPLFGSRQYAAVRALTDRYPEGRLILTGHSKGGHNALYGLAVSPNVLARAIVFNAQGFGPGQLNAEERLRLRLRSVNYVAMGDVVGLLLLHPERRVPVRRGGSQPLGGWPCKQARAARAAHRLESLRFSPEGSILPAFPQRKRQPGD